MGGRYVVTAGYVTVQTAVPGGRAEVDIPRGAVLPDDVPAEQIDTALARGQITAVAQARENLSRLLDQAADSDLDEGEAAELAAAEKRAARAEQDGPPPMAGTGSSAAAWRDYAAALDVAVPAEATRAQIIDAVAAAGHPTS